MKNESRIVVGVDIGGTKVAAGLVKRQRRNTGPMQDSDVDGRPGV